MSDDSENGTSLGNPSTSRESDHHYGTYVPQNLLTHVKQIHGGTTKMTHFRSSPHVDHSYRAVDPEDAIPVGSRQSELTKASSVTTPAQKLKPHFVTVSKTQKSVTNPSGESRIIYYPPIFSNQLTPELKNQLASELKSHLATEYKINHITSQHGKKSKINYAQSRGSEIQATTGQIASTSTLSTSSATMTPQALRAQLHQELENRARMCAYLPHRCTLPRIPAYDYCVNHILEDQRAPYKQCSFVYTLNGKRCPNAAPKGDSKQTVSYCYEHSRHAQNIRTRSLGRYRPPLTMESSFGKLTHYVKTEEIKLEEPENKITPYVLKSSSINIPKRIDTKKVLAAIDPLKDIALDKIDLAHNVLNYASESDSDEEATVFSNVNQELHLENSDDESVEPLETDPLQHSDIYTAEEVNRIMRDKLIKLQSLYVEQVRILHHNLKKKRMKYLTNMRREQETLCSIKNQPKDTPKEIRLYEKLKAYYSYQKRSGIEAVLHERSVEKKAKLLEGLPLKATTAGVNRCIFTEGGVKCGERAIPCTKYCKKHILQDKRQVLFKACGVEMNGVTCREPVTGLLDINHCWIHYKVPEPRSYNIRKDNSDSDNSEDDEINVMETEEMQSSQHIQDYSDELNIDEDHRFGIINNTDEDEMRRNYDETFKLTQLKTQSDLEKVTLNKEHLNTEEELEQCLLGPLLQSEDSQEEIEPNQDNIQHNVNEIDIETFQGIHSEHMNELESNQEMYVENLSEEVELESQQEIIDQNITEMELECSQEIVSENVCELEQDIGVEFGEIELDSNLEILDNEQNKEIETELCSESVTEEVTTIEDLSGQCDMEDNLLERYSVLDMETDA